MTQKFLLAGLVVCTKCGKRFVGTSAVANRYRYRYTCFSRQRYGTKNCNAELLPADELDAAVLDATMHTYERTDLFDKAVKVARHRAKAQQANHAQEFAFVDVELAKAQEAIEPHFGACGTRLQKLGAKVADPRARREELLAAVERASATAPDADELAALRDQITDALANGTVPARNSLLQSLVHEISVEGRDRVVPWFRVPGGAEPKVRALGGWAGRPRQEPGQSSDGSFGLIDALPCHNPVRRDAAQAWVRHPVPTYCRGGLGSRPARAAPLAPRPGTRCTSHSPCVSRAPARPTMTHYPDHADRGTSHAQARPDPPIVAVPPDASGPVRADPHRPQQK